MTHRALVKIGRLVTVDLLNSGPARTDLNLYQRGALKLYRDTPVLIDHDDSRPIGHVRELSEFGDTDGDWLWAHCTIDRAPAWLKE
jgi:hypothetical protein